MENLRDIRENIRNIKNIQQIMNTMKMISSARIKKAQNQILNSRPFSDKMTDMLSFLKNDIEQKDSPIKESWANAFFESYEKTDEKAMGLILITADKGLCGAFNSVLIKEALKIISENKDKKITLFLIGKKGRDFLSRIKGKMETAYEAVDIFPKIGYANADLLGESVIREHLEKKFSNIHIIYNEFKSMSSQKLVSKQFIPFKLEPIDDIKIKEEQHFLFEPNQKAFFELLLPRYIKIQFYRFLLESQAAELAARMLAMDAASKNAGEIVDDLSLKLNRTRQEIITNELSEIIGGAEALKG